MKKPSSYVSRGRSRSSLELEALVEALRPTRLKGPFEAHIAGLNTCSKNNRIGFCVVALTSN